MSLEIKMDLAATQPGLKGDPARLQQVFWNLLKNAVKFTPAHGQIFIGTHDSMPPGRTIVEIRDTGRGPVLELPISIQGSAGLKLAFTARATGGGCSKAR